jgi:hypothetical protein
MAMNKQEAAKLLSLIKLSYPTAYRDIDRETANATVNMWQMSFPDMPYPIMEQAFNHFRMVSKFPPTVAEMVEELKKIYWQATEGALIHKGLGNVEAVDQYRMVMAYTARYTKTDDLGGLNIDRLPALNGGEDNVQRLGASRGDLRTEDRLPFLDAGRG